MPTSPPHLCVVNGCPNLVFAGGKCDEHRTEAQREYGRTTDSRRPSASARGYDRRWQAASKQYLLEHPLCESARCSRLPSWQRSPSEQVDHIDGLGPRGPRGYDPSNWQALCAECHSRKTVAENGGFGRRG